MCDFLSANMEPIQISALAAANKLLGFSDPEIGDVISNLKLQKLLYYMQGYHIACFKKPLFPEEIEKWQYGPVVPEIYRTFKSFGAAPIVSPTVSVTRLTASQEVLFHDVWGIVGQYSASRLMQMTHGEDPFLKTEMGAIISKEMLYNYFIKYVEAD